MNEGLIKDVSDIFTLRVDDLEPLERFAEKSAENLVESVNNAKEITLPRLIFSLGIRHVGEESAIALANHFISLKKLISAEQKELENVPDVGPRVAESIVEFFKDDKNKKLVEKLLENGVTIKSTKKKKINSKLKEKSFVFTGTLQTLSRDEAKEIVRSNGGSVSGSVSKNTDYLVAGEKPGSKYEKSKKLGVNIITESQFKLLVS